MFFAYFDNKRHYIAAQLGIHLKAGILKVLQKVSMVRLHSKTDGSEATYSLRLSFLHGSAASTKEMAVTPYISFI